MNIFHFRPPRRPATLSEEAAAWALRRQRGQLGDGDERRFVDWLAGDETRIAAYEDARWALDALARHAGAAELRTLRSAALAARGNRFATGAGWRWAGGGAIAASLAAGALWLTMPTSPEDDRRSVAVAGLPAPPSRSYRTGVGERSAVTLPDGSIATLDTDSALTVDYSARERSVHLLKGQALFKVAHGKPLPFQVYARGERVTAVGTTFNVRIDGDRVEVAMIEGKVRIRRAAPAALAAPTGDFSLAAGDVLSVDADGPVAVRRTDVRQLATWQGGLLVFNDARLADAVAEINRYTTRPVAIDDPAIGDYRVSGVFKSNDPDRFAQAMTDIFPIEIVKQPDGASTLHIRRN